jgi:maltose O-acetyltransferase
MNNFLGKNIKDIFLNTIASTRLCPLVLRRIIYRVFGHNVSRVLPGCILGYGKGKLFLGKGSFCNYNCFFDLGDNITIGSGVSIGMNVTFINSSHKFGNSECRAGEGYAKPIRIEDGCWIGANVVILPGVRIRKGCIIGAGSIVTKDCESNGLYSGNPAKRIKNLNI